MSVNLSRFEELNKTQIIFH